MSFRDKEVQIYLKCIFIIYNIILNLFYLRLLLHVYSYNKKFHNVFIFYSY